MEGETEHGIAHVLIQRQDGTEKTAMGQISSQIPVICTNAKVHTLFMDFFLNDSSLFSSVFLAFYFNFFVKM